MQRPPHVRHTIASYFSCATASPSYSSLSSARPSACESLERKPRRPFPQPQETAKLPHPPCLLARKRVPLPNSIPTRSALYPNPPSPSDRHTPEQKPA